MNCDALALKWMHCDGNNIARGDNASGQRETREGVRVQRETLIV